MQKEDIVLNDYLKNNIGLQVEGKLGSGAFGDVYKIYKISFDKKYYSALKVISIPNEKQLESAKFGFGNDTEKLQVYFDKQIKKLTEEISILYDLKGNSNIVSYEDMHIEKKEIGANIFLKMECLTPLNVYLRDNSCTISQALKIGQDICEALDICHSKKIIHRDIKENNIFITDGGNFKLGDFGVSKRIEDVFEFTQVGSASYMAPEIKQGIPYDHTVDIYSLGIVLYRILNNKKLPFQNTGIYSKEEILLKLLRGEKVPKIQGVTSELSEIIIKCIKREPKDRWQSAKEFKEQLMKVRASLSEEELNKVIGESPLNSPSNEVDETKLMDEEELSETKLETSIGENNLNSFSKEIDETKLEDEDIVDETRLEEEDIVDETEFEEEEVYETKFEARPVKNHIKETSDKNKSSVLKWVTICALIVSIISVTTIAIYYSTTNEKPANNVVKEQINTQEETQEQVKQEVPVEEFVNDVANINMEDRVEDLANSIWSKYFESQGLTKDQYIENFKRNRFKYSVKIKDYTISKVTDVDSNTKRAVVTYKYTDNTNQEKIMDDVMAIVKEDGEWKISPDGVLGTLKFNYKDIQPEDGKLSLVLTNALKTTEGGMLKIRVTNKANNEFSFGGTTTQSSVIVDTNKGQFIGKIVKGSKVKVMYDDYLTVRIPKMDGVISQVKITSVVELNQSGAPKDNSPGSDYIVYKN